MECINNECALQNTHGYRFIAFHLNMVNIKFSKVKLIVLAGSSRFMVNQHTVSSDEIH